MGTTPTTSTSPTVYGDDDDIAAEDAAKDAEPAPVDTQQDESPDLRDIIDQANDAAARPIEAAMAGLDEREEQQERDRTHLISRGTYSYPEGRSDHRVLLRPATELPLLNHSDEMLEILADAPARQTSSHYERAGMLQPEDAWRAAVLGDLRIFERSEPAGTRLVMLVDNSGSMSDYMEPDARPRHGVTGATLAWEVVGALTTRYPEAEVFMFDSNSSETIIQPVANGQRPFGGGMANLDCAALLWLRDYLDGALDNTVAVIVSDGWPRDLGECQPHHHLSQVAHEMADAGLSYISVLVNYGEETAGLYPAEYEVRVNSVDDFAKVSEAFARIDQRV